MAELGPAQPQLVVLYFYITFFGIPDFFYQCLPRIFNDLATDIIARSLIELAIGLGIRDWHLRIGIRNWVLEIED